MILIIGPAFSGKREYAQKILEREFHGKGVILTEVQEMIPGEGPDMRANSFSDEPGKRSEEDDRKRVPDGHSETEFRMSEMDLRMSVEHLADDLYRRAQILTASETGSGIVPLGADQRRKRELQGYLLSALAQRAERVVRVFYGLPEVLKDENETDSDGT